jgi:hypothetical protein
MSRLSDTQVLHLRQLGWDNWDPIGIRQFNDRDWRGPAADEYDRYMCHVFNVLSTGGSQQDAITYLDEIASLHMGLGPITDAGHAAAVRTVDAIASYVRGLSGRV